jgi:recombination protein RecA
MPSAAHLRLQIEAALAHRIPSALTPPPRVLRPTAPTGIPALDQALDGGFPIGAITELSGPECSGRTSLALSFVACLTQHHRVCAWVDVSDALDPESAAASGVDLNRLLWIRCGPEAEQLQLPGMSGLPPATSAARQRSMAGRNPATPQPAFTDRDSPPIRHDYLHPHCCGPAPKVRRTSREVVPQPVTRNPKPDASPDPGSRRLSPHPRKPWSRLDQALRATDLLLQAGGFSAVVLDMGSIAPEFALRVPLATWFRCRAAADRTHASVLLLTQHACSKSSAGLVLRCLPGSVDSGSITVFTGAEHRIEIARERNSNVVDFARKPPQSDHSILWSTRTPWSIPQPLAKAGRR